MKKLILLVTLLVIIIISIPLLISNLNKPIILGVIGDYSTNDTTASVDSFRATELAIEELNELGRNYELVRFDLSAYGNHDEIIQAIDDANVEILVGPTTSGQYFTYKAVLDQLNLPTFLNANSSASVSNKPDNLFRLTDSIVNQGDVMMEFVHHFHAQEAITVFYTEHNIEFSKQFADILQGLINDSEDLAILIEVGDLDDPEVQRLLLQELDTEVAIVIAGPSHAGIIAQLITMNNPDLHLVMGTWSVSERTIEYTLDVPNPIYVLALPPTAHTDVLDRHTKRLLDIKNVQYNIFSNSGYETMYFIDYVLEATGSAKLKDIQAYVHSIDNYNGQFNHYTFNTTGDGGLGYAITQIDQGQYIYLEDPLEGSSHDD